PRSLSPPRLLTERPLPGSDPEPCPPGRAWTGPFRTRSADRDIDEERGRDSQERDADRAPQRELARARRDPRAEPRARKRARETCAEHRPVHLEPGRVGGEARHAEGEADDEVR